MRDGWNGAQLLEWLTAAAPHAGRISPQNLSNWRLGGYRIWLKEQERLDQIRARADATRRELEAGGLSAIDKLVYDTAVAMEGVSDPVKAAGAIAALRNAITQAERARTDAQRARIAQDQADLARKKFQRDTCDLFVKWFADKRAQDVAADPALSPDQKTELLGKVMFGEDW